MKTQSIQQAAASLHPPIETDPDGFLLDPARWNKSLARALAHLSGVDELTPRHWAVVYYLREHHLTYGSLPPMSQVCRTQGLDRYAVKSLFGGCLNAWRTAGLPNPGDEARSYMD